MAMRLEEIYHEASSYEYDDELEAMLAHEQELKEELFLEALEQAEEEAE